MIHLTVQGIDVEVAEGTTVLEAARKAGIKMAPRKSSAHAQRQLQRV